MSDDFTHLLWSYLLGVSESCDRVLHLVYDKLCTMARRQLNRASRGQTLDTGILVQETYFRLIEETGVSWQDRGHFFAICARTMRRILVDFARKRQALKRGAGEAGV